MKEVVPFDRVFIAPPFGLVEKEDYLSFKDYGGCKRIGLNYTQLAEYNYGLYRKWLEEQE